jgi:hypothetical protein
MGGKVPSLGVYHQAKKLAVAKNNIYKFRKGNSK